MKGPKTGPKGGRRVDKPERIKRADLVRGKLEKLGISESDVVDAVQWARLRTAPSKPHSNRKGKKQ